MDTAVYVGSEDGHLYALEGVTGDEIWHFRTGAPVRSTPAADASTVYVGSADGNLYALDAATGLEHWRFVTGAGPALRHDAAVAGGIVMSLPSAVDGVVYLRDFYGGLYVIGYAESDSVPDDPRPMP